MCTWVIIGLLLLFSCPIMSDSAIPWTAARQACLCFTNSWSLPEFISIASVMPSSHHIFWHPFLLLLSIFPNIRAVLIRWPKYWTFSFSISPSYEDSGLTSHMIDCFDLFAVQGTLRSLLQHHSSRHQFFSVLPSLWSSCHNCMWPLGRP